MSSHITLIFTKGKMPKTFPKDIQFRIYFALATNIVVELVADVAELADALDSKSGIREDVWVRPPPSAPISNPSQHAPEP